MKRIFFVEDDLSLIGGLSFALKKQGYEIDIARTSMEAVSYTHLDVYKRQVLMEVGVCRNALTVRTAIAAASGWGKRNSPVEMQ